MSGAGAHAAPAAGTPVGTAAAPGPDAGRTGWGGAAWLDALTPPTPDRHAPPAAGLRDAAEGRLPYPVWCGAGALDALAAIVRAAAPAHRYALVTDTTVGPLHGARVAAALADAAGGRPAVVVTLPAGEAHKTRDAWAAATDALLDAGCGRDTTVVALGGGVVGDVAGFVAATFMRGVPVVQCPTTLLAMLDASVGGKTGIDTPHGKNLVGAFHPPAAVVCDPAVLATLPRADLVAGGAEALKHGVIADERYLMAVMCWLANAGRADADLGTVSGTVDLVARSVALKAAVVAHDEREGGVRKVLNFGHTLGHAVEAESGYALRHGEAVAIGMALEADAAERAGVARVGTAAVVASAIETAGLPVRVPPGMTVEAVLARTRADKKARAGAVEYALPTAVGAMAEAEGRWAVALDDALVRAVLAAGGASAGGAA